MLYCSPVREPVALHLLKVLVDLLVHDVIAELCVAIECKDTHLSPGISTNFVVFHIFLDPFPYVRKPFNYPASSFGDFTQQEALFGNVLFLLSPSLSSYHPLFLCHEILA